MGAEIFDEIFLVHCKYLWKPVSPSIFSDAVDVCLCWNLLAATRWTAECRAQHENFTEGSPPEPPIYLTTDWTDTETALQVAGPGPAFSDGGLLKHWYVCSLFSTPSDVKAV